MSKARILIVEDESIVAMELKQRLKQLGYNVIGIADRGEKAVEMALSLDPNLIMMDIMLKGHMTGIDTVIKIRETKYIPVIYLTAYSDESTLDKAKATEPHGYLTKPFQNRDLETTLEMAVYKIKAEKKLAESERKYRGLFDSSPAGVFLINQKGDVLEANSTFVQIAGIDSGHELHKVNLANTVFCKSWEFQKFITQATAHEKVMNFETQWQKTDGTVIDVSLNASLLKQELPASLYFNCTVLDISEAKRSAMQIKSLAKFPEENPFPVMRIQSDYSLEYANPASSFLLEKLEGVKGKTVPPDLKKMIAKTEKSGEQQEFELKINDRIFSFYVTPIAEFGYCNIYARDITESKKLESMLQQAMKMEAVGQLAGGIAHDFNNILTAMNGYAEISLMKLEPGNTIHGHLTAILKAGKRAAKLVAQLLAFSRKQIIELKTVSVNALIDDLSQMLSRLIGEDIDVEIKLAADIGSIKADPGQIEQIFTNLIVNARDAILKRNSSTSEKKITIETEMAFLSEEYVRVHPGSTSGHYVVFSVSDTGIGMDKKLQNKIFEPFFTTKEVGKGTGLGMATVFGIVKQNSGNIYVYSEPNKGTTFKIYWPVIANEISAEDTHTEPGKNVHGNEKILVIEDEDNIREFIRTTLETLGYRVFEAENGETALELIKKNHNTVDLAITDVIMPKMNGKEFGEQVREYSPDLKILYTSGYTVNHIVHSGVLEDGINFIQKPYSIPEFTAKIRALLDADN